MYGHDEEESQLRSELKNICFEVGLGNIVLHDFQEEFFLKSISGINGFLRVSGFIIDLFLADLKFRLHAERARAYCTNYSRLSSKDLDFLV